MRRQSQVRSIQRPIRIDSRSQTRRKPCSQEPDDGRAFIDRKSVPTRAQLATAPGVLARALPMATDSRALQGWRKCRDCREQSRSRDGGIAGIAGADVVCAIVYSLAQPRKLDRSSSRADTRLIPRLRNPDTGYVSAPTLPEALNAQARHSPAPRAASHPARTRPACSTERGATGASASSWASATPWSPSMTSARAIDLPRRAVPLIQEGLRAFP